MAKGSRVRLRQPKPREGTLDITVWDAPTYFEFRQKSGGMTSVAVYRVEALEEGRSRLTLSLDTREFLIPFIALARIWFVIAPHVVTVDDVFRPPPPGPGRTPSRPVWRCRYPRTAGAQPPSRTSSSPGHRNGPDRTEQRRVPGRAENYRTLTCVLTGNNPRFPRTTTVPSTTKLTHRLMAPQTDRGRPEHARKHPPSSQTAPAEITWPAHRQPLRTVTDAQNFPAPRRRGAP